MPRKQAFGRGIAELILIVVGVLVALTLEAWWGTQAERRRQEAYYPQLLSEFNDVVEEARRLAFHHGRNVEYLRRLKAVTASGASPAPRDSVLIWANALLYNQNFSARMPIYTDFVSRIGIGEVYDDGLRRALIEYDLATLENEEWDDYLGVSMITSWEPALFSRIPLLTGLGASERIDLMPAVGVLATDLHFQNLLSARLLVEATLVDRRGGLAESAAAVVSRLEAEMNQRR